MVSSQKLHISHICSKLLLLSIFKYCTFCHIQSDTLKNAYVKNAATDKLYTDCFTAIFNKEWKPCPCSNMDESQNLMPNKRSKTQKLYSSLFYFYEAKEQAKSMESDRSLTSSCLLGRKIDWEEQIGSGECRQYCIFLSGCIRGCIQMHNLIVRHA